MARYTGPVCRLCRREGMKLFLKGDRCYTGKCAIDRRAYAPGQHGQSRGKKPTEYGIQLREKQKVRRIYGVQEKQFRSYYDKANRQKGIVGENLLRLLERRLDNVVFQLGFATSRPEARQLVRHGHFTINGRRVDIPSFLVRVGDVVGVKEASKSSPRLKEILSSLDRTPPKWMSLDAN
ncbi:MAG: 30S ribosomal protein S4, partial [Desulfitobacterium hafniense]